MLKNLLLQESSRKRRKIMSAASYDELLKQVESLRSENGLLRRELQDNSVHLTKLESEACNMKEVLTGLQTSMVDEVEGNYALNLSFEQQQQQQQAQLQKEQDQQQQLQEQQLQEQQRKQDEEETTASNNSLLQISSTDHLELDQNSNASFTGSNGSFDGDETTTDQNWMSLHRNNLYSANTSLTEPGAGEDQGSEVGADQNDGGGSGEGGGGGRGEGGGGGGQDSHPSRSNSCSPASGGASSPQGQQGHKSGSSSPTDGSPSKRRSSSNEREIYTYIQELDQERTSILREIETEDKHRKWYYEQLEGLTKKIESLPLTETYNLQADMTRRQLEYEVSRLSDLMADNLGTSEQIAQRHEARLARIRMIESEMLRMQQRHHDQAFLNKTGDGFDQGNYDGRLGLVDNGSKVVTIGTQTPGEYNGDPQAQHEQDACNLSNQNLASLYHGSWPIERQGSRSEGSLTTLVNQQDTASVMSFNSSNASSSSRRVSNKQLGTKVEMVYSLLSMLGTHDKDDMSRTLFAMSSSQDSCIAMRQSGCLPLLVQLLHGSDKDSGLLGNTRGSKAARARAAAALHNIVHSHPDDKRGRREARVLRLLEQIRAHCDQLREMTEEMEEDEDGRSRNDRAADIDHHPGPAIAALMKLSFDEEHRHAICTLGGLQAIAELLQVDHDVNGNTTEQYNITMRRYACMALTNLTFGDGTNKALLCSMKSCMRALVAQLHSPNEDLRQVAASVLRNLSWRADLASKKTLREVGAVTALMCASMEVKKESTLKSILSALWNLSAHCSENKADICAVDGSLAFLVSTLTYKSPSKTLAIIENGGGILRNISSHIAVREDYRKILRQHGCLQILLKHLRSPSLTIVSNACGTLWNLSARCPEDQKSLWEMGAVSMLRNLVHSKHKMISMGSAAALKNLLAAKPAMVNLDMDRHTKSNMPSLHVRKQRALEAELDQNLAETCDNVESPQGSPTETRKHIPAHDANKYMYTSENCGIYQVAENDQHRRSMIRGHHLSRNLSGENSPRSPQRSVSRSASQDSVGSTHSDISYDRNRVQDVLRKSSKLLQERQNMNIPRRDHSLQRSFTGSEGMRTSGSDSSITDRSRNAPNSRIMQVMHEVAVHAGIDPGPFSKEQYGPQLPDAQSTDGTPHGGRRPSGGDQSRRTMPVFNPRGHQPFSRAQGGRTSDSQSECSSGGVSGGGGSGSGGNDQLNNSQQQEGRAMPFSNLSHRMENLHLNDDEDEHIDDEPINYSMKYSESPRSEAGDRSASSAFVKPVPKVGNFVAGLIQTPTGNAQQQKPQNESQQEEREEASEEPQQRASQSAPSLEKKQLNKVNNRKIPQYSGYAETDLDIDEMDQPTNYSIRFAEHTDDGHFTDQPINYSTRFKEPEGSCVECKMEAQRCNEYVEHLEPHIDDDAVLTFCTEGTPLNYLSTATSMNDLSGKANAATGHKLSSEEHKAKHGHPHIKTSTATTKTTTTTTEVVKPTARKAFCDSHEHHNQAASAEGPTKNADAANIQNNNVPVEKAVPNSEQVNLYSYDDTSASASPSEKPTKYCTEGTPMSFSRVSSLSSLHSSEAQDNSHQSPSSEPRSRDEVALQSIDENTSLEISTSADVTLQAADNQNESFRSTANTTLGSQGNESTASTTTKSVTFDDNNQVQETPLMFSRCSSLGSLSSFDAHSVHSSVVSEYSRRASEVVSPSDLPDSPSDTMPPSPTHRKSPVKFIAGSADHEESGEETEANVTQIEKGSARLSIKSDSKKASNSSSPNATIQQVAEEMFGDATLRFGEEKSPQGFSCGSSLSRLTFDDEPMIEKDINLRRVPLGQEDNDDDMNSSPVSKTSEQSDTSTKARDASPIPKVDLDDLDDLSVSEGEEDMLAACIHMAMPNNSRKKMRRSTSDSHLKKKAIFGKVNNLGGAASGGQGAPTTSTPAGKSKLPTKIPNVAHVAPMSPYQGSNIYSTPRMNASYHGSLSHNHEDIFDDPDMPRKFATEGTPLNFSNAGSIGGSLSDLSMGDLDETQHQRGDGDSDVYRKSRKFTHSTTPRIAGQVGHELEDAKSDISSMSEDNEDLLSEAIESAMPKNKSKTKKMDRVAEGSDTKADHKYHIPSFKPKKAVVDSQQAAPNHRTVSLPTDTMMSYATEGTPLNFSTANSLSDLSCDDEEPGNHPPRETKKIQAVKELGEEEHGVLPPPPAYQDTSGAFPQHNVLDSPRVFGIEGTPVSFSRNDSLSSLSCDEDADLTVDKEHLKRMQQGPRGHVSPGGSITPPSKGLLTPKNKRVGQLSGVASPVASSQKGQGKSKVHRSLQYNQEQPPEPHLEPPDQPQMYAVEGTPHCFSRNSSLSSLNSDDHEGLAQRNSGSGSNEHSPEPTHDQCASLQVEDTPRVFSRNSSLSSLSVESLSSEPTASEKALLEECINAAMPKSKTSKKKKSPTSGIAPRIPKMKTSRSDESSLSAHVGDEPPKNAMASQSKNESITEESRGPNDDASGVVFRRSASEGSKTRFGWRRPSTCDTNETKQSKEVYNHEQVLGYCGQGEDTDNITGDSRRFLLKNKDKKQSNLNTDNIDSECDTDALSSHLGEHNDHLQNVFMEMPTAAVEGSAGDSDVHVFLDMPAPVPADIDSEPDKQRISEDDDLLPTDKEQQAIGINEKDHCSEPSETEDNASISSSQSVDDTDADRHNITPHTKERASFYLEGTLDDCHLTCNPLEDSGEVPDFMDITNETFPDSMGVSLISDISTPGDDIPPPLLNDDSKHKDVGNLEECMEICEPPEGFTDNNSLGDDSTNNETPVISSEDTTVIENQDLETMLEMSPEQERALEENASLIVSELSLTRHLSSSTLDDEAFIENETISLVSNDCMSDTASEASVALSSSSKTMSEQASESSTVSLHSSAPSSQKSPGPRLVKPNSIQRKPSEEDSSGRGIRGKRRSLFSRVTPKPQKSPSPPPGKTIRGGFSPPKGKENKSKDQERAGTSKPAPKPPQPRLRTPPPPRNPRLSTRSSSEGGVKGTPPKTPPRDSSYKTSTSLSSKTVSPSLPGAAKTSSGSPKSARNSKASTPKSGLGKITSKINTGLPKTAPKGKDQKGKSKQSSDQPERPPPPVKQGTFTKDEPSVLSEHIPDDTDKRASGGSQCSNRSSAELKYSNESQEKLSKAGGAIPKRNSSGSERPGSSRSLDSDAELPLENGIQKSSSPAPLTAVRKSSVGSVSKSSSSGSIGKVSKSSSNSSFGKTGSNTSINKAGSNTSVNKLGTKSPLTKSNSGPSGKKTSTVSPMKKTQSNTSITKTTPSPSSSKTNIKKSESQSSLGQKMGVGNGRPSTPPSRKLSGGSSPSPAAKKNASPASATSTTPKKATASGIKKPAVSKIAGLWRRDDSKSPVRSSTESAKSTESESKAKPATKSPKPGRRSLLSVVKSDKSKKEAAEKQKKELTRSSTYDKLPMPGDDEGASGGKEEESTEPTPGTKRQWRRTYTIDSSEDTMYSIEADAPAVPSNTSVSETKPKKSQSLWRRNAADSDAIEVKPETTKKLSLWKRSSVENGAEDSSGSLSKLPRPGNSGSWLKKGGSMIPSSSKSSGDKMANGHIPTATDNTPGGKKPLKPTQLLGNIPKKEDKKLTVSSPKGELNAAIVAPYNYIPTQKTTTGPTPTINTTTTSGTTVSPIKIGKLPKQQFTEITYQCNDSMVTVQGLAPTKPKSSTPASSARPLTKTEMLIARRRQSYLNSRNRDEQKSSDDQGQQSTCLVTTV